MATTLAKFCQLASDCTERSRGVKLEGVFAPVVLILLHVVCVMLNAAVDIHIYR